MGLYGTVKREWNSVRADLGIKRSNRRRSVPFRAVGTHAAVPDEAENIVGVVEAVPE